MKELFPEAIQHIIIMQFPVVLMLGILSLQARNAFRTKIFSLIAAGWFFNLAYLLVRNYPDINSLLLKRKDTLLSNLATPLVFASSGCFWLAARKFPRPKNILLLRRLPDRMLIGALIVTLLFVLAFSNWLPKDYPLVLIPAIPDVAVDLFAIAALAVFFKQFSDEQSLSGPNKPLYYGTLLYALIQPLYFFSIGVPEQIAEGVEVAGFFLGLSSKVVILLGLLKLFTDVATKAHQEEARIKETRRTVERIAHELGTPVAQMSVHVKILLDEASLRGKFHQSLLSLDYALHRIEAIMDASRELHLLQQFVQNPNSIAGSKRERAEQTYSINTLVQTALMAVKETRDENVKFSIQYSGNCCIRCVSVEIIQVFVNIFRNAFDALPRGAGRVTVETLNVEENNTPCVRVVVQDTGEGIAPEVEAHMFNEGFSTRGGPGRGHGLFITKRLVELNGGKIAIQNLASQKGSASGAKVTLEFPRVSCRKESYHGNS